MKPKLNRKDQSKQSKLRKMLASGLPLSALLSGLLGCTTGCVFTRTTGDVPNPNPETSSPQAKPRDDYMVGRMPGPSVYQVRKGDTLQSIAKRNGMTVEQLKKLNGFNDQSASSLKVGQKIRIR